MSATAEEPEEEGNGAIVALRTIRQCIEEFEDAMAHEDRMYALAALRLAHTNICNLHNGLGMYLVQMSQDPANGIFDLDAGVDAAAEHLDSVLKAKLII